MSPYFKSKAKNPVQQLSKFFALTIEKLKLNKGVSDPRERVSFHTLRHSFASWAVMTGIPL